MKGFINVYEIVFISASSRLMTVLPTLFVTLNVGFLSMLISLVDAVGNLSKELWTIAAEKPDLEKSAW